MPLVYIIAAAIHHLTASTVGLNLSLPGVFHTTWTGAQTILLDRNNSVQYIIIIIIIIDNGIPAYITNDRIIRGRTGAFRTTIESRINPQEASPL
jgi:hypothetical protein